MFELTVTQDFGRYRRGDAITDPTEVESVLAGEGQASVVKVPVGTHAAPAAVDEPAAEAEVIEGQQSGEDAAPARAPRSKTRA